MTGKAFKAQIERALSPGQRAMDALQNWAMQKLRPRSVEPRWTNHNANRLRHGRGVFTKAVSGAVRTFNLRRMAGNALRRKAAADRRKMRRAVARGLMPEART